MLTEDLHAPLILVVEDDDNHVELIQRSFADAPEEFRLEIAGSLSDAKRILHLHSPGLVLTDYRLPDGDGSEIVAMAAGAWPVIMMTSHGSEQVAVEAMKIGVQDYIVKSAEAFEVLPRTVSFALKSWSLVLGRRQADEAALRARRDWEQTFDAVPDLICIIDLNHRITRVNRAMADRCGFKPKELIGRMCYEVVHGLAYPPAFCTHIKMVQDGAECVEEIEEKHLNGFFHVSASPLYDSDGRVMACVHVARDITDRKMAEKERLELEQQFQQTQKLESLGVLAGGIAHDFNNILTIILGHCFMAMEDANLGLPYKTHVQQIESAANRAADLCRQMLTYAGKSPLVQTKVNLWLLLDDMVKMLASVIKKNVTMELDLNRDVPEIKGDNSQIQQIVMNLIINAAEAVGDNSGSIRVVLKKTIVQPGQSDTDCLGNVIPAGMYACLEVSDNGCGIDEETQKRIFEPFFTTKFTGRGLGLSAMLGIVTSHNGALQLSSKPGVGTTFTVYFPLPSGSETTEMRFPVGLSPAVKCSGTILLVDDEEGVRVIGSALLKAMGFSTITASNGREGLEIYREYGGGIDLILLDLIMPEMGGLETYQELRKIKPDVPIVFCSGYGVEVVLDDINTDAFVCAIKKPYKPDLLRHTILDLLVDRPPEIVERLENAIN